MKTSRILGGIALFLAVLTLMTGIVGSVIATGGTGKIADKLNLAKIAQAEVDAFNKAATKTAPSALKKAAAAKTAADKAMTDTNGAAESAEKLRAGLTARVTGNTLIDELFLMGGEGDALALTIALDECDAQMKIALSAVNNAENKLISAQEGVIQVMEAINESCAISPVSETIQTPCQTVDEYAAQLNALSARAQALIALCAETDELAAQAQTAANARMAGKALPFMDRFLLLIAREHIGVVFTAILFFTVSAVFLLFYRRFLGAWKKYPVFSTGMALLAILAFQVYALGFNFPSVSAWLNNWYVNAMNVLRSNSSVGMIALGMTLVIITGGIDLAVGSTLAGVATVVMVILDISANGAFTGAGITGVPNFLIAIAAGILTGVGVGALIGLGVTKGRVPPFIITLGVMEIVRSVAQYFTKSFKTEVPKSFQVIANAEIGGQMLLPILYWLILAVAMYIISKHTAFGRHIYAVGSNERASRLSGINVNRVKLKVYMLMGFIVAIAAVTQVARLRGIDVASAGSGYEMNAIAAVVVGGTSMAGGRGSIIGTMLGVLIIGIMNNLLVLLGIDAFLANAFTGAIIIFAVLMQRKDR